MRAAAFLFLLAAGCESSATAPLDPSSPPDAGIWRQGWLFDPAHRLEPQNRILIFDPQPPEAVSGSSVELLRDRFGGFVVAWLRDRAGRRDVVERIVSPRDGYALSPISTLASPEEAGGEISAGPFSSYGWQPYIFYFVGNTIHLRFRWDLLNADDDPPGPDFEVLSLAEGSRVFGFETLVGGFVVFTETAWVSHQFRPDGQPYPPYPTTIEGLFAGTNETFAGFVFANGGTSMLWTRKESGETVLFAAEATADNQLVAEPRELLRRPVLRAGYYGPAYYPRVLLFDDERENIYAFHLDPEEEPRLILRAPGTVWRAAHGPSDRVLIAYSTGTDVALRLIDHRTGEAGPVILLGEGHGCVEGIEMYVHSSDDLVLAWIAGCDVRRVWFAEVRAYQ